LKDKKLIETSNSPDIPAHLHSAPSSPQCMNKPDLQQGPEMSHW